MKITLGGESLTATDEQLKKIKEILGVKKGRVERGGQYWFVGSNGYVFELYEDFDSCECDYRYLTGNYFHTKEEAEKHLEYTKALGRVTRRIEELNNEKEGWWIITLNSEKKIVEVNDFSSWIYKYVFPHCASREIARQIISECESDLKVIFNV